MVVEQIEVNHEEIKANIGNGGGDDGDGGGGGGGGGDGGGGGGGGGDVKGEWVGGGVFKSLGNGDRMVVEGPSMRIYNRETGACVGQVEVPSNSPGGFVGAFPWGQMEMQWDGASWREEKGVVWSAVRGD